MKHRWSNTYFWKDPYIVDLDPTEKLLFKYFLDNPLTSNCGIYEITLREVAFDTAIDRDAVLRVLDRFAEANKIFYEDGFVIIKNWLKHQNLKSDDFAKGVLREVMELPETLIDRVFHSSDKLYVSQLLGIAERLGVVDKGTLSDSPQTLPHTLLNFTLLDLTKTRLDATLRDELKRKTMK